MTRYWQLGWYKTLSWTGVELSTRLLTEDDTEIDADPASLCGDNKGVDEA